MKSKKYKRSEHFMRNVYGKGFDIRAPYQFLADSSFCLAVARHKFELGERLTTILGGASRVMVTNCTMVRLGGMARGGDEVAKSASWMARKMELRRCRHDTPLGEDECIGSLIGDGNKFHYGVATDEEAVKKVARSVAGTPLVYMERVFPLLEAPTRLTLQVIADKEAGKLGLSKMEAKVIKSHFNDGEKTDADEVLVKHKHRKAKGPNPLSMRKSKRSDATNATIMEGEDRKPRRKRKSKKKLETHKVEG